MLIYSEGKSTINTEHLCNFILNGKKIEFYFDSMTARENWNFENEEEAKKAHAALLEKTSAVVL